MNKSDMSVDETLADILHSLAWSGKYTDAGQEVVSELEIERAKNRLDQYYADFYRSKILEARKDELSKACHYWEKNPTKPATYMIDRTAQFNSGGA